METALIVIGFIFIILVITVIGSISTFMIKIDVCGSDPNRDL